MQSLGRVRNILESERLLSHHPVSSLGKLQFLKPWEQVTTGEVTVGKGDSGKEVEEEPT